MRAVVNKGQQLSKPHAVEEKLKRANEVIQQEVRLAAVRKNHQFSLKKNYTAANKLRKDNPPPQP